MTSLGRALGILIAKFFILSMSPRNPEDQLPQELLSSTLFLLYVVTNLNCLLDAI